MLDLRDQPHSQEAERVVLGSLMYAPALYDDISEIVTEADFFLPAHAEIYRTIQKIASRGAQANPIAIVAALGGAAYVENPQELVAGIVGEAMGAISAREYARMLADLSGKRAMVEISYEMMERAHGPDDAEDIREEAERRLFGLSKVSGQGPQFIGDVVRDVLRDVEAAAKAGGVSGIPTGFRDLDSLLGGLQDGNLIILAGRPAMGKTGLALNIASHASKKVPTLFCSLEMSRDELTARELSAVTGIQSHAMRTGRVDMCVLVEAGNGLSHSRLLIDDRAALSVAQVRNAARRAKRQHGVGLVVVDYLQLMREKAENKVVEISEISRGLKAIAKELDIPVLALSQLSRSVEQRDDKRPVLSDLRESGSIEQDADAVLFIYREEYYLREPEQGTKTDKKYAEELVVYNDRMAKCRNIAQVIVAKHRHGPCGMVELHFNPERVLFSNLDRYGMAA